jgi:hypothetical protein
MASDMESLISELLAKCYYQKQRYSNRSSKLLPSAASEPEPVEEEIL